MAAILDAAARFLGPKRGMTKAIAYTTASASTDLSAVTGFAVLANGPVLGSTDPRERQAYIAMIATTDVQFCFDDSAVTIGTDDPFIPANTWVSVVVTGKFLGLKALATNGTLYCWVAS